MVSSSKFSVESHITEKKTAMDFEKIENLCTFDVKRTSYLLDEILNFEDLCQKLY